LEFGHGVSIVVAVCPAEIAFELYQPLSAAIALFRNAVTTSFTAVQSPEWELRDHLATLKTTPGKVFLSAGRSSVFPSVVFLAAD